MQRFDLYLSGIRYGSLQWQDETIQLQRLVFETAQYSPFELLDEPANAFYKELTKVEFSRLPARLAAARQQFGGKAETLRLATGETYHSEDGLWYMQRQVKFPLNLLWCEGRVAAMVCPAREIAVVLTEPGMEAQTPLALWQKWAEVQVYPVHCAGTFMVPMGDGVQLATDVYLPGGVQGPVPAVLVRTPYGKEEGKELYYRYVQRGYAVVLQDVRGRSQSQGEWLPNYYEVEDGDDTLNWIAAQSWSSGRVGMVGGSYLGYVQWAAAASGNPHLSALISVVCAGSAFVDTPRPGGSLSSGTLAWAFAVSQKQFRAELMDRNDWDEVLAIRPLTDIPKKALGYSIPFWDQWARCGDDDAFWQRSNWQQRSVGAQIPALIQSGWFDDNGMGTTQALELVQPWPAGTRKVILGPWQHSGNSRYDLHALSFANNALRFDLDFLYFEWFEHFLKGVENGVERTPPVEYYTVGENRWKTAENWPLPTARPLELYLASSGCANTSAGDGALCWEAPAQQGADSYDYDPQNPATHIIDMCENEISVPEDYTEQEQRSDYLCYTTPPLQEPITVTGDLLAELYVSSTAPDTDFIVRLTQVDETGRSVKLADGVLSARYRGGFEKAEFMQPGQVYALTIRTSKISCRFAPGNRLRLTITSSAKNLVFPNSNTKEGVNSPVTAVAHNTVHHGGQHASRLRLWVEQKTE